MTEQSTEQSDDESPDFGLGEPQPLKFQLIADDGKTAVHEALVVDCKTPGTPVLGLTVTVASSIRRASEKQVMDLLSKMKAAFVLLSEPPPDDGGPDGEEPFDSSKQILIEFRLASFTGPEPAGIALTVVTTAGLVPAPAESEAGGDPVIHVALPEHVSAGLSDYYHSNSNGSFTAYVTAGIGDGTLSSHGKQSKALHPHKTRSMSGKVVVVTASSKGAMSYSFTGSGHLTINN